MKLTRYLDTVSESRSNRSARAFKTDRVVRGSNARNFDSSSFSPPRFLWMTHVNGWLSNSRGRTEMKGPNMLSQDSASSLGGLCK